MIIKILFEFEINGFSDVRKNIFQRLPIKTQIIVRKVKLILDWIMFLDLGKLCSQFRCVALSLLANCHVQVQGKLFV